MKLKGKLIFWSSSALIASLFYSCTANKCATMDQSFVANFRSQLEIVASLQHQSPQPIAPSEYGYAIMFLSELTGFSSNAQIGTTQGFAKTADYKQALKKWRTWLEKNRCSFNSSMADSVLKTAGITKPN